MHHSQKNQQGFTIVEGLLIILILAVLGFVGFYVWNNQKSNKTTASTTTSTANSYAGWKSYSDDLVSLQYPGTWAAVRDDNVSLPGTKQLDLKGPDDAVIANATGISSSDKASIVLTIFQNSNASQNTSVRKIYDVLGLNIAKLSSAKLVVTNSNGPSADPSMPAQEMDVTTDTVKVGTQTLDTDLLIGTNTYNVSVAVADNDATGARISNISLFVSSQSVKDLIKIINSLSFK